MSPTQAGDRLVVDLMGDLAGILSIATAQDRRAVTDDLSKVQPVQESESSDDTPKTEKAAENGGLDLAEVMVDLREEREPPSLLTGRLSFQFGRKQALVAGARFELATFRL